MTHYDLDRPIAAIGSAALPGCDRGRRAAQIWRLAALAACAGWRPDKSRGNLGSAVTVCCTCRKFAANLCDSWRKSSVFSLLEQQICSKSATNKQRLAVSSGLVAGMALGAARESKRDQDQVIEIARFPIPEQGITGRHGRIGNDVWHRQGSRRQGTRPDIGS